MSMGRVCIEAIIGPYIQRCRMSPSLYSHSYTGLNHVAELRHRWWRKEVFFHRLRSHFNHVSYRTLAHACHHAALDKVLVLGLLVYTCTLGRAAVQPVCGNLIVHFKSRKIETR
ncbi:hypothetical protein PISMIDRAFT_336763 [Pisolithus microcarpus 441]|uniref:Uncharacterized protein n=1 Tax=Pisolithus microcarpus 441 TaxID=765257 RepID=A0A0C9YMG2_9AGAM|nr:hypothetical protein BKA83DRAFT_336763 [Pisolithus microcarpus]KIK15089.1 hypothetical protein PISMIDRAFT_336763 [Pisolithus microcarpus 441]